MSWYQSIHTNLNINLNVRISIFKLANALIHYLFFYHFYFKESICAIYASLSFIGMEVILRLQIDQANRNK